MIKALVMDVDGTLTDGKIFLGNNGEELKAFNVKDGLGIKKIIGLGIIPIVITGRSSNIIERRCKELGIDYLFQNVSDKLSLLKNLLKKLFIGMHQVAYIGDDINDIECIKNCGLTGCPKNSVKDIVEIVDYVCCLDGGEGCVREFIEYIIQNNKEGENK